MFVVTGKTDCQKVFLGDLAFGIKQLRMDSESPGAVMVGPHLGGLGYCGSQCVAITRTGNGTETLAHHLEGLPEQSYEASSVN